VYIARRNAASFGATNAWPRIRDIRLPAAQGFDPLNRETLGDGKSLRACRMRTAVAAIGDGANRDRAAAAA